MSGGRAGEEGPGSGLEGPGHCGYNLARIADRARRGRRLGNSWYAAVAADAAGVQEQVSP